MKAIFIVKHGKPEVAFEVRETEVPQPKSGEVLIKSEAFGLNFADVMARNGMYREAPPPPFVVGYEVVGHIEKLGPDVTGLEVGQRVVAFTRFGAYAEYAVTDQRAVAPIGDMDNGIAVALATQYCTAWYAGCIVTNMFAGERVLIQAAAGGVGTALVQIAKWRGCEVFGTAGSEAKLEQLRKNGVDHPINYRTTDFAEEVRKILGNERLDLVFDSIGGKTYSQSRKLLGAAGRMVNYGAAQRSGQKYGILSTLKLVWDFGIIHPVGLIAKSQSACGVNMLRVADYKPHIIQECITNTVKLAQAGVFKPVVGGRFKADQIAEAHNMLEGRKSVGKIVVEW